MDQIINYFPELDLEEATFINNLLKDHDEEDIKTFAMIYRSRRRDPQMMLVLTIVGLLGFAGIQRFMINQIGMGILYFFTGGLCLIGTIVDLVNHKSLAFEYNQRVAMEVKAYLKSAK